MTKDIFLIVLMIAASFAPLAIICGVPMRWMIPYIAIISMGMALVMLLVPGSTD